MSNYFKNIQNDEAFDALCNKFILSYKYKLDKKITISKKFKLVARNINKVEMVILSTSIIKKIIDIFNFANSMDDFSNVKQKKNIFLLYLKKNTDFDLNTPILFDLDGNELCDIYDKIFDIILDNYDLVDLKHKHSSATKIAYRYLSNLIVIYSEDNSIIYDFIKNNSDVPEEIIEDHFNDFICKYIDFWNSINFSQHEYLGINIYQFSTKLKSYLFISNLEKSDFCNECLEVFNNPIDIKVCDDKLLYLIISRFNAIGYMDDNNRIILYWSLLEMLLTHKPNDKNVNDSVQKQLIRNIANCFEKYGKQKISKKEIQLLYDYRSIIAHGDLLKIDKILKKIKKLDFVNELKLLLSVEEDIETVCIIDFIRIRLLYIYSTIMKLYFDDYQYVMNIKNQEVTDEN